MRNKIFVVFALMTLLVAGCGSNSSNSEGLKAYNDDSSVLNIVMGSEQHQVFNQVVKPWCDQQRITCNAQEMGSVDQAMLLDRDNCSDLPPQDVFWFASSVFEQIGNEKCSSLTDTKTMFSSPLVFAGYKHVMDGLGFTPGSDTPIKSILQAVESGKANVWVTNPAQSNSGATVLMGFLNYFAGNPPGKPLTQAQLDSQQVRDGITRFARAFSYTPPSTGTMMDECVQKADKCDTMFTYEALVIEKNRELVAQGREPMTVVYPQGSLAFADSPLGFLPHGDNVSKKANFEKLQAYLLSSDAQSKLVQLGRRPANSIGLSLPNAPRDVFNPQWGIETDKKEQPITFPSAQVIQSALDNYQTVYRQPGDFIYCIDGSGSMEGDGWNGVKKAADILFDYDVSRKYKLLVNPKDSTTVIIFNGGIKGGPWTVNGNDKSQLLGLRNDINENGPGGGTNIRGCLAAAADIFRNHPGDDRKRTVVLMTDGQDGSNDSSGIDQLASLGIPVIAIGFGDVDTGDLTGIANATSGTFLRSDDVSKALRTAAAFR